MSENEIQFSAPSEIKEEWRSIEGYEGFYEVSNTGKVRSLDRQIVNGAHVKGKVKDQRERRGYPFCTLFNSKGEGKMWSVHRLVMLTFVPNPRNCLCVNHIDGNPRNNHISNLEWCTQQENILHSVRMGRQGRNGSRSNSSILTADQVRGMKEQFKKGLINAEVARMYNTSQAHVGRIRKGLSWNHL